MKSRPEQIRAERAAERFRFTLADGRHITGRHWTGRGTALVLLHGLLDTSRGWDQFACSSERPCYAVDLPGFGGSELPKRNRMSAYAQDVGELLEGLDLGACVLVGHSLGGGVAAELAERASEQVAALVLLAPAGFGRIPLAEMLSLPLLSGVVRRTLPLALANPLGVQAAYMACVANGKPAQWSLVARLCSHCRRAAPGALAANEAVVASGRSPRALYRRALSYSGPVGVLWGESDRLVPPAHEHGVRAALPHAHIERWTGMGHHPQCERPDELARFIERCARAARMPDAALTLAA